LDTVAGGPAILVGNSMGGLLAMMEAERHPEKVSHLVLVGAAQPRPAGARLDAVVALPLAAHAVPGVGERFLRWRAARRGPPGVWGGTPRLVCAEPPRPPPPLRTAALPVHP